MPTLIISLRLPLEYHNRLLASLPKICAGALGIVALDQCRAIFLISAAILPI
jgi:hypothetical protein